MIYIFCALIITSIIHTYSTSQHFVALSEHNVLDVRPVLDYYKAQGGDVMSTYRRKREELATATEEKMKQTQTNTKRWRGFGW